MSNTVKPTADSQPDSQRPAPKASEIPRGERLRGRHGSAMRLRGHLKLLGLATLVWLAFFVAGLPDYYQQYSTRALVVFVVVLLVPVWAAGYLALRRRGRTPRTRRAVAISFWFTVPLFLYDLAYCGLHLGHGLGFVISYWYLSIYYVVPWLLFPPTAAWLERVDPTVR